MTKSINLIAAISAFSFMSISGAALTSAHAERIVEEITVELTYLGTDLPKQQEKYSKRMNFAIHDIVTTRYEEMEDNARKAVKAAQKEWGAEHVNTLMAFAMADLARANAINFYGGASRAEADLLINQARIFSLAYPEFPGSYYIEILADISKARLIMITGTEAEAAEYYDKALAAMKQSPGISNIYRVQGERDYLMVP